MGKSAEQKLSRVAPFWQRAICRRLHFQSKAAKGSKQGHPKIRLKFEVARQASSPILFASVRAVPWAAEAEKQLSRIAHSACKLSGDDRIFRAGLLEETGRDTPHPRVTFEV